MNQGGDDKLGNTVSVEMIKAECRDLSPQEVQWLANTLYGKAAQDDCASRCHSWRWKVSEDI